MAGAATSSLASLTATLKTASTVAGSVFMDISGALASFAAFGPYLAAAGFLLSLVADFIPG